MQDFVTRLWAQHEHDAVDAELTPSSRYALGHGMAASGLGYRALLSHLVDLALARHERKSRLKRER